LNRIRRPFAGLAAAALFAVAASGAVADTAARSRTVNGGTVSHPGRGWHAPRASMPAAARRVELSIRVQLLLGGRAPWLTCNDAPTRVSLEGHSIAYRCQALPGSRAGAIALLAPRRHTATGWWEKAATNSRHDKIAYPVFRRARLTEASNRRPWWVTSKPQRIRLLLPPTHRTEPTPTATAGGGGAPHPPATGTPPPTVIPTATPTATPTAAPTTPRATPTATATPGVTTHVLTVGPSGQYRTISAAVTVAGSDASPSTYYQIEVASGTYTNDFPDVTRPMTIEVSPADIGQTVLLDATEALPSEKGIVVTTASLTVGGLTFEGAEISHALGGNGAAIRDQNTGPSASLIVENSTFRGNQEGILQGNDVAESVQILNSTFANNGNPDQRDFQHAVYIDGAASLVVDHSLFCGQLIGHDVKSRALATTVENS